MNEFKKMEEERTRREKQLEEDLILFRHGPSNPVECKRLNLLRERLMEGLYRRLDEEILYCVDEDTWDAHENALRLATIIKTLKEIKWS